MVLSPAVMDAVRLIHQSDHYLVVYTLQSLNGIQVLLKSGHCPWGRNTRRSQLDNFHSNWCDSGQYHSAEALQHHHSTSTVQ